MSLLMKGDLLHALKQPFCITKQEKVLHFTAERASAKESSGEKTLFMLQLLGTASYRYSNCLKIIKFMRHQSMHTVVQRAESHPPNKKSPL